MKGQIIREYGQTLEVEKAGHIYTCFARKNRASMVVGDEVEFSFDEKTQQGIIEKRLPRNSLIARSDRYHPIKEMAANLTQVLVMCALSPPPNEYYLDQYLVAAELAKLTILIVINKYDLWPTHPDTQNIQARYEKLGYSVLFISTRTHYHLSNLKQALAPHTTLIIGPSGVGKSSLINALLGHTVAKTQAISEANQKGQHTTSASMLYHLPDGGNIIDIPGIREFQLPKEQKPFIVNGFRDFWPYLGQCRYRNCAHRHDADCALLAAKNAGFITGERLQNYYRMLDMEGQSASSR